jgi:hypothetical protein
MNKRWMGLLFFTGKIAKKEMKHEEEVQKCKTSWLD